MSINKYYYYVKPFIPRSVQLYLRKKIILRKLKKCRDIWPIDEHAATPPPGWSGWPEDKRFALILTHDVDTARGAQRCIALANLEESHGFRSSFNFVPERYKVLSELRHQLTDRGFEVGVHGINHDGKYFNSFEIFNERVTKINRYLKEWNAVGYRNPSMLHNLDWMCGLDILYDASTFDTDPFEPQSDGVGTIFPFSFEGGIPERKFIELPYTLPQDFTLFVLMREDNIDIWKRKLDWVAKKGGMVLLNTHPDYMNFSENGIGTEEYPVQNYDCFLKYLNDTYKKEYWHVLPKDLARWWMDRAKNTDD